MWKTYRHITINDVRFDDLQQIRERSVNTALPQWERMVFGFLQQWFNERDCIEVRTSGSTGEPKTIRIEKNAMIHSAQMTVDFFKLNANSVALLCLPPRYIAGMMMIVRALVSECKLQIVQPSQNPFKDKYQKIHFAAVVPMQLHDAIGTPDMIEKIDTVIVGGAPLSNVLEQKLRGLHNNMYATYGMTETLSHVALRRINGEEASEYFTVLNGIEIGTDERNCLVIHAPQLCDKKIETNDIVEMQGQKQFKWLGRFDNIINSGGVKIIPEQVEKKLSGLFHGKQYIIASLPDEKFGEKIILIVEKHQDTLSTEEIKVQMRKVLEVNEVPKEIFFVESLVYTANGKPDRKASVKKITF